MKKIIVLLLVLFATKSYSLEVLTYNVQGLNPFSKESKFRQKYVCDKLKNSSYDIVLLQEAWLKKDRNNLKKCGFPYSVDLDKRVGLFRNLIRKKIQRPLIFLVGYLLKALVPDKIGYDTGLMILSRHPILNTYKKHYSINGSQWHLRDGEMAVSKGVIGATINHHEFGEIFVATTHLVSEYIDKSYVRQRLTQLKELKSFIDQHSNNNPVILGGDFNISPPSKSKIRYLDSDTLWGKVKEIFYEYKEYSFDFDRLTTYPGKSLEYDEGFIDHIFATNEFRASEGHVKFIDQISYKNKKLPASDHYAVSTKFEY